MQGLRLTLFEARHQLKSLTFIIVVILFVIFVITQMGEIFHYPLENQDDIKALQKTGERTYLYVKASDEELKAETTKSLKRNIENGGILPEKIENMKNVIEMLKEHDFEYVYEAVKSDAYIEPWLKSCRVQFENKIGSIKEINGNIAEALGEEGYSKVLYERYVTYIQVCASFLIFPIFLFLLTRDSRSKMTEIIMVQALSPSKYLICRYLGALIPLFIILYVLGVALDMISTARFIRLGWDAKHSFFLKYFLLFIMPTVFYLSAFIMFFALLFKKAVAVLPLYVIYVIFNVTPKAFENGSHIGNFLRVVVRLDRGALDFSDIIINRSIYIVLGLGLIFASCKLYKSMQSDLRKEVII